MWWKIYFWLVAFIIVLGSFNLISYAPLTIWDFLMLIVEILGFIGLYSYVFNKKILAAKFWKSLFLINATLTVIGLLEIYVLPDNFLVETLPFLQSSLEVTDGEALFGIFFYLPMYYIQYKLGFTKDKKSKK